MGESQTKVDAIKTKEQLLVELKDIRKHVIQLKNIATSKNKVVEVLKKSEEQFRLIAENSIDNIGIVTFDLKTKYLYVSPSVKFTLGYEPGDLIGKSFLNFIHPKDKKKLLPLLKKYVSMKLKKLLVGKESILKETIEFRFKHKKGNWRYMQSNITMIGKKLLSVSRDISMQKLVESKLQESEIKFRELSDLTFEGILIHEKGIAIDINLSLARMFGYKKEEIIGENTIELLVPEKYHSILYNNIKKNYAFPYEVEGRKKNGELFPIEVEAKNYLSKTENVLRVTAIRDLTERKRAEKLLSQSVIVEAINKILQESVASESDLQVATTCLQVAEKLTESKFGFIGEVNKNGKFNTLAISNPGWKDYNIEDSDTSRVTEDMEIRGIWGETIVKERSMIVNDPNSSPNMIGVPDGHPNLTSFLGVLLKSRGEIFGMIALANKEGGYNNSDLEKIESLAIPFVEAMTRKRLDVELKNYREHLETMVKERSKKLEKTNEQLLAEIKDRMKIEFSLRESESHYRQLFDLLPYGGEVIDLKGNIIDCSLSTAKMLGYEKNQLIGAHITKYLDSKTVKTFKENFPRILKGESIFIEASMICKNGEKLDILRAGEPIFDREGKVEGILALSIDITKRKKIEEKLKLSEKEYRELFDNSSDAIYIQDEQGRFLDVNLGVVDMYGYPKEFFIGKTPEFLSAPGKNDMDYILRCVKDAFNGNPQQFDFWGIRKNGELFPKIVRCKLGFYMGQKVIITFAIDITDRFNTEKEKAILEEQLQHAQKMEAIGALAGGIAHDFNNILGAIIGFTDLTLKNPDDGNKVKKYMKNVMKASLRAKDMVKQILSFSRKDKSTLKEVYISNIIAETIKFLRSSLPATIRIESDIDDDINPILADPTQINQVLMNLCTNGAFAMKENGGLLKIYLKNVDLDNDHNIIGLKPGKYQLLKIQDFGKGINESVLNKIFEPYFTTKNVGEGTGMGLAVVYGIVKNYGGEIKVSSEIGRGTVFDIYLPETKVYHVSSDNNLEKSVYESGTETILFVDDEPLIAELSNDLLIESGYSVKCVTDSIEALDIFKQDPDKYDILITDMTMPNMTGTKLTTEVHKIRPDIPVIVCTGFNENINDDNFRSMGVDALVVKPMDMKEFLGIIRNVLDNNKRRVNNLLLK